MRGRTLRFSIAVLIAAMVVALSGVMQGCASRKSARDNFDKEPIRIGAILSLSGTYASMGEAEKQTLDIEVAALNKNGGIKGRPIEVITENDNTDESKAVTAAQKLIQKDKVSVILGATGTGPTMAIRGQIEKSAVPQLSMAGGNVITGMFSQQVFQTPWTNKLLIAHLFSTLKEQGVGKVALVTDSGGYGKDGRSIALEEAQKFGIEIVLDTTFKPGDTDMSSQVSQIKSSSAEAVVLWNAGKEAPIFVKQARLSGISLPLFGGSGQAKQEFIEGAGSYAQDFTIITGKSFVPSSWREDREERNAMESFFGRFKEKYSSDPDIFAGHAYDALHLSVAALNKMSNSELNRFAQGEATKADYDKLRLTIEQTDDFTGFGGHFTFTESDHNGLGEDDITFFSVDKGAWKEGIAQQVAGTAQSQNVLEQVGETSLSIAKNAALYALIALGFIVIYLTTGSINFAQGEFVALGGLTAALLYKIGIPLIASCALTLLAGVLLGYIFNEILIRPLLKGAPQHTVVRIVIITIGASVLLRQIALHIFGPDELSLPSLIPGEPFALGGILVERQTVVLIALTLCVFLVFAYVYMRTRLGKSMRAYQQSPMGAEIVGISAMNIVRKSVIIATVLGVLAGILITPLTQIGFDSGVPLSIKGFTVALMGGLTHPLYAVASALILSAIETLTGVLFDPLYKDVVAYVLLLAILIFRPQGLFSRNHKEKL